MAARGSSAPSSTIPPPIPVPTVTITSVRIPWPAPNRASAQAAAFASFSTDHRYREAPGEDRARTGRRASPGWVRAAPCSGRRRRIPRRPCRPARPRACVPSSMNHRGDLLDGRVGVAAFAVHPGRGDDATLGVDETGGELGPTHVDPDGQCPSTEATPRSSRCRSSRSRTRSVCRATGTARALDRGRAATAARRSRCATTSGLVRAGNRDQPAHRAELALRRPGRHGLFASVRPGRPVHRGMTGQPLAQGLDQRPPHAPRCPAPRCDRSCLALAALGLDMTERALLAGSLAALAHGTSRAKLTSRRSSRSSAPVTGRRVSSAGSASCASVPGDGQHELLALAPQVHLALVGQRQGEGKHVLVTDVDGSSEVRSRPARRMGRGPDPVATAGPRRGRRRTRRARRGRPARTGGRARRGSAAARRRR